MEFISLNISIKFTRYRCIARKCLNVKIWMSQVKEFRLNNIIILNFTLKYRVSFNYLHHRLNESYHAWSRYTKPHLLLTFKKLNAQFHIISKISTERKKEHNRLAGRKCGISSTLNYLNKCKLNSRSWHVPAYKSHVTARGTWLKLSFYIKMHERAITPIIDTKSLPQFLVDMSQNIHTCSLKNNSLNFTFMNRNFQKIDR